ASRMRRAQQAVLASRPYEERLRAILNELAPNADPELHPLLARRGVKRAAIILVTTDRGLVGALNTTVIRAAIRHSAALPAAALDNAASEQSARMVSMRNATDNAAELIQDYTLAANKARQGRITKEMLEIASGAEALAKG